MTNKVFWSVAATSCLALAVALNVMQADVDPAPNGDGALSLAPISLGNPAAAAMLKTRQPKKPGDYAATAMSPAIYSQNMKVGNGDTLAKLLDRAGVESTEAHYAIQALTEYVDPRRIRRGQELSLRFETAPIVVDTRALPKSDTFIGFSMEPDYKTEVLVSRLPDGTFRAEERQKKLDRKPTRAAGVIENSLYVAGRDSGIPAVIIARMIRMFSWDVDFQRDIRTGDSFEVMYEDVRDERGKTVYNGAVTYASITLSGKRTSIYRYKMPDGSFDYFDENGKSSRKALMRTPIDGARLSSTFGKRKHPILGYTRMHKGTDFAAPTGTPIYAAGNGTVVYAGRKGGYGKYIRIRHNGTYETAYAHLNGYARGVRSGNRVEQGQVIGYVGSTGRSTGPHLHYEVLYDGKQVNPMRVKMPSGKSLEGKELKRFLAYRQTQDKLFASLQPTEVASTSTD